MTSQFASRVAHLKPSAIREVVRVGAEAGIISFAGGYPDAELFPIDELARVFGAVIEEGGKKSLQYGEANGLFRLREQIAERMVRDGVECTADDIMILQGAQQGLDLVAKMFIDKGDIIVTENPTFLGALLAFNQYEPRYLSVEIDGQGMNMDELRRLLATGTKVKFLYTIPDFQNPTGVTMSLARRKTLIQLANEYDFTILEDTPYRDIRFEGENLPSLKSLDTEGRVIYLGSFSKTLAPGLRLGWVVATNSLIHNLGSLKLASDTQCSTLNMSAASLLLDTFDMDRHLEFLRQSYRRKKELMVDTIKRTFPTCVSFTNPSGGLFTWLSFPRDFDAHHFMMQRAIPEARVAFVPGSSFFPVNSEANHARVSYATAPDAMIVKGMALLGNLLSSQLALN